MPPPWQDQISRNHITPTMTKILCVVHYQAHCLKQKKKKKCHSLLSMKLQYKFKWFDVLMNLLGKKTYGFFFFLKTFVRVFFSFLFIFVLYIRKTDWTLKNYSLFFSFFFLFFWFKGELLVKHTNDSLESPYLWRKSVEYLNSPYVGTINMKIHREINSFLIKDCNTNVNAWLFR